MKMKKALSLLLSIIVISLFLSVFLPCCLASSSEDSGLFYVDVTVRNNYYEKKPIVGIGWNDNWFFVPGSEFNIELAKTSVVLSGVAFGKSETVAALEGLGFDSIYQHYPTPTPQENDTISYTLGHKYITAGDKTKCLIAIVTMYTTNYEWYSNFNVGPEDDHLGFCLATQELYEGLCDYIVSQNINEEELCFYMNGHSRGAAVANLLGARLIDGDVLLPVDKDNIYCYTSGTPTVSKNGKREGYESIFNIITVEDVITRVPLSDWGFYRYGTDVTLPCRSFADLEVFDDRYAVMKATYADITEEEYHGFDGCRNVDRTLNNLFLAAPDQAEYSRMYEDLNGLISFDDIIGMLGGDGPVGSSVGWLLDIVLKLPKQFLKVGLFFTEENHKIISCHSNAAYYCWLDAVHESELLFGDESADFWRLSFKGSAGVRIFDSNQELLYYITGGDTLTDGPAVYSERDTLTIELPAGQVYGITIDTAVEKFEYIIEQNVVRGGEVTTINKMKYGPFASILNARGSITLGAKFGQPEKSLWALDIEGNFLQYYSAGQNWSNQADIESIDSMDEDGRDKELPVLLILGLSFVLISVFGVWYRARANKK